MASVVPVGDLCSQNLLHFCSRFSESAAREYIKYRGKIRSMESPKRKRISDVNAGVLMIDQVKPAILEGTAVRFDPLSKGKGIK